MTDVEQARWRVANTLKFSAQNGVGEAFEALIRAVFAEMGAAEPAPCERNHCNGCKDPNGPRAAEALAQEKENARLRAELTAERERHAEDLAIAAMVRKQASWGYLDAKDIMLQVREAAALAPKETPNAD